MCLSLSRSSFWNSLSPLSNALFKFKVQKNSNKVTFQAAIRNNPRGLPQWTSCFRMYLLAGSEDCIVANEVGANTSISWEINNVGSMGEGLGNPPLPGEFGKSKGFFEVFCFSDLGWKSCSKKCQPGYSFRAASHSGKGVESIPNHWEKLKAAN